MRTITDFANRIELQHSTYNQRYHYRGKHQGNVTLRFSLVHIALEKFISVMAATAASVENLVIESIQFTNSRAARIWRIIAAIACTVAIIVTALLIWQVLKDCKQCEPKPLEENGGKDCAVRREQPKYGRPCPRQPSLLAMPDSIPPTLSKALSRIGDLVNTLVNSTAQLPAISMNVFYQNRTLWSAHYGSKDYRGENKPNDQTVYRIGSISKVFVVLMVYKFYEEGLIDSLDDPLSKYVPEFYIQNPYNMKNITIRQIASQMSGLPREAPCFYICANVTSEDQLQQLKNRSLVMPPGVMPSYSNLGYALLGRLLTEKLLHNQTFEGWVIERILKPLNMSNTGFEITDDVQRNMAFPHQNSGKREPFMIIHWVAPSGQMYSTIEDLTKLGMMFSQPDKQTLFRPGNLREMMYPMNIAPDGVTVWGAPWEVFFQEHYLVRNKAGAIDTYKGTVSVVPELQLGMNLLISSTPFIPKGVAVSEYDIFKILLPAINETLFELKGASKFAVDPKPYIGNYTLNTTNVLTSEVTISSTQIVAKEDALVVFYPKGQFEVLYIGDELIFQARFARASTSCYYERAGTYADFFFFPFNENGFSTGFKVPGYPMVAKRVF